MTRYYVPSNDEVKVIDRIVEQMKKIATEKFYLDNPFIDFPYKDGLQYAKLHENKEIAMVLRSLKSSDVHVRVMVQNGLLLYYKYNGEKTYVAKLKDVAKSSNVKIKNGRWKEEFEKEFTKKQKHKRKEDYEDNTFDGFHDRPTFYNKPQQEPLQEQDFLDTKFGRYLMRKEYCQQYREMFGTESTEVTDEYYFFGDF